MQGRQGSIWFTSFSSSCGEVKGKTQDRKVETGTEEELMEKQGLLAFLQTLL